MQWLLNGLGELLEEVSMTYWGPLRSMRRRQQTRRLLIALGLRQSGLVSAAILTTKRVGVWAYTALTFTGEASGE